MLTIPTSPKVNHKLEHKSSGFLGVRNAVNISCGLSSVTSSNKKMKINPFSPQSSSGFGKNYKKIYNPTNSRKVWALIAFIKFTLW